MNPTAAPQPCDGIALALPELLDLETLESLACAVDPTEASAWWISLQSTEHLLGAGVRSDPHTGEPLPQSLRELLVSIDGELVEAHRPLPVDRLMQVAKMCAQPLKEILERHRTRILREHRHVPFHRLREVDATSVAWLARQPGRTVREKLAGRQSVLGVVRRFTPDTLENRLVVSLAALLGRLVQTRLTAARQQHGYDRRSIDNIRLGLLEEVAHLCQQRVQRSDLAEVPTSLRPRPNNALLSDPLYSRVWRAWRWLREYPDEVAGMWPQLDERLRVTFLWLLAARLVASGSAMPIDGIVRAASGHDRRLFGLECLHPNAAGLPQWRRLSEVSLPILFDVRRVAGEVFGLFLRLDDAQLVVELLRQSGGGITRASVCTTLRYEIGLVNAPLVGRRGVPLAVRRPAESGNPPSEWRGFGDVGGLAKLVDQVAADVLCRCQPRGSGRDTMIARTTPVPPSPCTARRLGIDPTWPLLSLADDSKVFVPVTRGWGIRFDLADDRMEWIDGDAQRNVPLHNSEPALCSLSAVLAPDPRDDRLLLQSAARRIIAALARELELAPDARVAYAVPDCTDEFSQKSLRSAMSAAFSRALPIWRSVAATMGWQRSGRHDDAPFGTADIQDGDPIVVIDVEAPILTTTVLIARYDRKLSQKKPETRGFYWERRPSPPRGERDEAMAWGNLLEEYAAHRISAASSRSKVGLGTEDQSRLALNLIRSGLVVRLLNEDAPLRLPLDVEGQRFIELRPDPQDWQRLLDGWIQQLREPAEELAKLLNSVDAGRRAHLLLLGRIFRLQASRTRRVFEAACQKYGLECVRIVTLDNRAIPDGAQHCLLRLDDGCRTWAEWLPDLHLEVLHDGHFDELPLLKEQRIDDPLLGTAIHIQVADRLVLPAGPMFFEFPLVSGRAGRRPLSVEARLQASCFPLAAPVQTKVRVSYRYGLDSSYELSFEPENREGAPFPALVAQWQQPGEGRHEGPYAGVEPAFNAASWEDAEPKAVSDFISLPSRILSYPGYPKMRPWVRSLFQRLWSNGRSLKDAPNEIGVAASIIVHQLIEWTNQSEDAELSSDAFETLCQLHEDAPNGAVERAIKRVQEVPQNEVERFKNEMRRLASVMGDGQDSRRACLDLILSRLRTYQSPERFNPRLASQTTRALVTALWRHPGLIDAVVDWGPEMVLFLANLVRRTLVNLLDRVPSAVREFHPDKLRNYYGRPFQDACELVLALLRVRNRTDLRWLRGGEPFTELLARHIRLLDGMFVRAGIELEWRVPGQALVADVPNSVSRISHVAWTLNVLLTGDDALRLVERAE